jgi:hypothetical protein
MRHLGLETSRASCKEGEGRSKPTILFVSMPLTVIHSKLGDPTILVNDAAVIQGKLIVELTDEDVKQ